MMMRENTLTKNNHNKKVQVKNRLHKLVLLVIQIATTVV